LHPHLHCSTVAFTQVLHSFVFGPFVSGFSVGGVKR
jgi:hypothetical protein